MNELFNKPIVAEFERTMDNEVIKIVVVSDDEYYNVHSITGKYRNDESNSLVLQEPKEVVSSTSYFNQAYMVSRLMEYIIWDRFHDLGMASTSVSIEFEEVN